MWSQDEFLYVIHNKMDHAKNALPRLQVANKMIYGLGQLPITLTSMITPKVMVMRDMDNIPMSCGLMIPILQLGHYSCLFKLWKKLQLVSPKCCLNTLPKTHFSHVFCKDNLVV
jgi:hypothetical protein